MPLSRNQTGPRPQLFRHSGVRLHILSIFNRYSLHRQGRRVVLPSYHAFRSAVAGMEKPRGEPPATFIQEESPFARFLISRVAAFRHHRAPRNDVDHVMMKNMNNLRKNPGLRFITGRVRARAYIRPPWVIAVRRKCGLKPRHRAAPLFPLDVAPVSFWVPDRIVI